VVREAPPHRTATVGDEGGAAQAAPPRYQGGEHAAERWGEPGEANMTPLRRVGYPSLERRRMQQRTRSTEPSEARTGRRGQRRPVVARTGDVQGSAI